MKSYNKLLTFILIGALLFLSLPQTNAQTLGTTNQKAVTAYQNARSAHRKALNLYSTALTEWQTAKSKYDAQKNTGTEEEAIAAAQNLALRAGEGMITFLELLRVGVQNIEGISDQDRTKLLSEIDKDLTWLRAKKDEIRSATEAAVIKTLAGEIRTYWNNIKPSVKRWTGRILVATANRVLNRLDGIQPKVDNQVNLLKEEGQDVANLEDLSGQLETKITIAQSSYNNAVSKYKAIKNLEQADEFFTSGRADLKATDTALREAYKILGDIISEIKTLNQNI